jgi:hypothetical protein
MATLRQAFSGCRTQCRRKETVNIKLKIFITIFCYISGVVGLITTVTAVTHKPAQSGTAIIAGKLGVLFLLGGLALTRKPRY